MTRTMEAAIAAVPVVAGVLLRVPLGVPSQYIGRNNAAQNEMGTIVSSLLGGWLFVDSYLGVLMMGVALGVAGASFGVALSLGSGWYPARYKGLAMGIAGAGNSGAVLAVLFAPPLAQAWGWRAVYGVAIFPMLLAMLLLQVFAKEPPDRVHKSLKDYAKILVERDAWIFNLIYMVTFGGFIGLTSFLPTLFHDQYGIPKQGVGAYAAGIIVAASVLRVLGGWLSDRVGGLRLLWILCSTIIVCTLVSALMPASPWVMVAILVVCFAAMGAGNGAVFQLVPLRYATSTAVAGSLIGEVGALAGGFLPNAMGIGRQWTGSFAPGFLAGTALSVASLVVLLKVSRRWTSTWVGAGGKALDRSHGHATHGSHGDPAPASASSPAGGAS